jgi:hypothetical protein
MRRNPVERSIIFEAVGPPCTHASQASTAAPEATKPASILFEE